MSELDANVIVNGQKAIATIVQTGTVIQDGGAIDATSVIQTENGPQKVVKTYDLNGGGGGGITDVINFVPSLPETGETGYIYGIVMPDVTRDNYSIVQLFTWYNNDWYAIGAYDVNINPTGIVYEQSFDSATGTWTVSATSSN